mgnify:CR=1 FL=1
MAHISFDSSNLKKFVQDNELGEMQAMVTACDEELRKGTGAGADFRGWLDLPVDYDKEEFDRIKKAAKKIQSDSEVLIVIGIGGSYLGARAAIEFLNHQFYNLLPAAKRNAPQIFFVGNSISGSYVHDLLDLVDDQDLSPSPARQRNLQSHSASSRKSLLKSMARKAQRNASMQRRIALAALLRRKQTQKVTNAS